MSAQILIVVGPDRGRVFPILPGATLRIGRADESDTKLTDPSVSRLHCELTYDGTRGVLKNLSDRGTQINGNAVSEQPLRHGDVARIGSTQFRFILDAMEESETILQPAPKKEKE